MFELFPFFFNNDKKYLQSREIVDSYNQDYDIQFRDLGDLYVIKGYLPDLTARDISIDFEKNKAILTIRRRQTYSNDTNFFMTIIQVSGEIVKTFYIDEVDVTKLSASFNNHNLQINIPKLKKISTDNENPLVIDVDNYKVE